MSQALYSPPSNASGHVVRCGGFYEWTRRGEEKQPLLFGLKDRRDRTNRPHRLDVLEAQR